MGIFNDTLKDNESLIKNEDAVDYDFIPPIIKYRENEQQYIGNCIKPLFNNRSGRNLMIYGGPGLGKTVATRHILRQLDNETDEIHGIYINCWQNNTTYKILLEICDQIGFKFTQNKKTFDLYKVVAQIINKSGAVFVFDEIDKTEDLDFLYFILEQIYKKTIIIISNYRSWLVELDERIKSRMMLELQEFRPYKKEELEGIIRQRVDLGLVSGVCEEKCIKKISEMTYKLNDVRSGIYLLKNSATIAEEKSKKKIEMEDVTEAIKKLDDFTIKNSAELETEAKMIYEVVKNNSGKKIGDLFKIYQKEGGISSYKTFQRKIAKLEEGKFIQLTKQTGAGGNTTIVEKKLSDY